MRKSPAQERSRAMVETLVRAAEMEIGERGLEATTTNHVAARAGVSIGSLYQYFDSLDAIVEAVSIRHSARLLEAVDARLRTMKDADPATIIRRVLKSVFALVESDPSQKELVRNWHRLRTRSSWIVLEQRMMEQCRVYLLRHQDEFQVQDLPAALFVVVSSLQFTVAHYLADPAPVLTQRQIIDTLAAMTTAYLRHGGAPPKRRRP